MITQLLGRLGIEPVQSGVHCGTWIEKPGGEEITSICPATGEPLARVHGASHDDYEQVIARAQQAFHTWRQVPAPQRGDLVRRIGLALREHKEDLGLLISYEVGKIRSEGEGEVQEMIDMCDFATGLSRQLYGLTMPSERPEHRLLEQWHPLGLVGVITAFNFPVAVWSWNAALAGVCGDITLWKPSQQAPLSAVAVQNVIQRVINDPEIAPVFSLCLGTGRNVGSWLAEDERIPLVSATGSCQMGRHLAATVAGRLGRTLLELGGNNGAILTESADRDLALRACLFAAVGTAGQRCTTLRRLIVHESIIQDFTARLVQAYQSVRIGMPWEDGVLMGPLISQDAVEQMMSALEQARAQGAKILTGGEVLSGPGYFVQPTLVEADASMPIVREETFAPILYVMPYRTLDEAIAMHNAVPQGLSSAIFTHRMTEAEQFLSPWGSDCGIANVNLGTSGAEIGGAFGGEKQTGGGREAGSDSWKAYMRRQTCTINFGQQLPLAQGVKFQL